MSTRQSARNEGDFWKEKKQDFQQTPKGGFVEDSVLSLGKRDFLEEDDYANWSPKKERLRQGQASPTLRPPECALRGWRSELDGAEQGNADQEEAGDGDGGAYYSHGAVGLGDGGAGHRHGGGGHGDGGVGHSHSGVGLGDGGAGHSHGGGEQAQEVSWVWGRQGHRPSGNQYEVCSLLQSLI